MLLLGARGSPGQDVQLCGLEFPEDGSSLLPEALSVVEQSLTPCPLQGEHSLSAGCVQRV